MQCGPSESRRASRGGRAKETDYRKWRKQWRTAMADARADARAEKKLRQQDGMAAAEQYGGNRTELRNQTGIDCIGESALLRSAQVLGICAVWQLASSGRKGQDGVNVKYACFPARERARRPLVARCRLSASAAGARLRCRREARGLRGRRGRTLGSERDVLQPMIMLPVTGSE